MTSKARYMVATPPPHRSRRRTGETSSPDPSADAAASRLELRDRLFALLDAIDEPIAIGSRIRDREGRLLDYRFEYANPAAARWAGVARESMIGRITGDLLPDFRASGYFDSLGEVVETGRP
jgi:PAS domain-containing protein